MTTHVAVYARVSPAHKLRIVSSLQKQGEVVAVIGDGTNDAPALKHADVGVAIGSGTDLAKEVADVVLLDDNFRAIGKAMREGRIMFQNIRKVFAYLIGDDLSELAIFLFALGIGLPLPLLPAQILWINLIEDGFPVVGLSLEHEEEDVMRLAPRGAHERIVDRPLFWWLVSIFFVTAAVAVCSYVLFLQTKDLAWARTMMFGLFCFDSLIFSFSVRSFKKPLFHSGMLKNRTLTVALIVGVAATLAGIYLVPFQLLLSTVPLSFGDLLVIVAITAVEIALIEASKLYLFKTET
jgi:Ca2+-transporting ATPase